MSIDVHIQFTGLCLFVKDPNLPQVHVFFPKTSDHVHVPGTGHSTADGEVEYHAARLIFDTAHLRSGMSAADGIRAHVRLEDRALVFPADPAGTANPDVPAGVVNVSKVTGRRVASELLAPSSAKDGLTGRVVLPQGAGAILDSGVCWELDGKYVRLPHLVRWTIRIPDADLKLPLRPLEGGGEQTIPTLYPIGGAIYLYVHHSPPSDLPPAPRVVRPPTKTRAEHFKAYYSLLEPGASRPVPVLLDETACADRDTTRGGSPYNCMLATGDPPPP